MRAVEPLALFARPSIPWQTRQIPHARNGVMGSNSDRVQAVRTVFEVAARPAVACLLCMGLTLTADSAAAGEAAPEPAAQPVLNPLVVEVTAAETAADDGGPGDDLPVIQPMAKPASRYREIYDSIPFSRSQFNANPAYQHEATMEILFGKLRPMTIHKYQSPPASSIPTVVPWTHRGPCPPRRYGYSRIRYGVYYAPSYAPSTARWY